MFETLYDTGDDHRIGRDARGRLYIWDRSGDTPLDTDDGPQQVAGPVLIESHNYKTYLSVRVEGDRTVRLSAPVAQFLVDECDFALRFGGNTWTCKCGHAVQTTPPDEDGVRCHACELGVERAFLEGLLTDEDVRAFGIDPDTITEETA